MDKLIAALREADAQPGVQMEDTKPSIQQENTQPREQLKDKQGLTPDHPPTVFSAPRHASDDAQSPVESAIQRTEAPRALRSSGSGSAKKIESSMPLVSLEFHENSSKVQTGSACNAVEVRHCNALALHLCFIDACALS